MKTQDKKNLIRAWPVYLLCAVLLIGMTILYFKNLSKHGNEPLPDLITKNLKGADQEFQSLDNVINNRQTWEPVLADWQGKTLPDLTFTKSNGEIGKFSDHEGRQIILIIGATWYPPFKIQLKELRPLAEDKNCVLIAVTAESPEANKKFLNDNSYPFEIASLDFLPEPYSESEGFPILFFIDTEGRLKLASVGLVPLPQARAVIQLPLPKP